MPHTLVINIVVGNDTEEPWLVWLSWLEHCPVNQKFAGLMPGQGTCLGCGFGP